MLAVLLLLSGDPGLSCLAEHPNNPEMCEPHEYNQAFKVAFVKACSRDNQVRYCACLSVLGAPAGLDERTLVRGLQQENQTGVLGLRNGTFVKVSKQCHDYAKTVK